LLVLLVNLVASLDILKSCFNVVVHQLVLKSFLMIPDLLAFDLVDADLVQFFDYIL